MKYGDSNTRWFHTRASARRSVNAIISLERLHGSMADEENDIANVVTSYFDSLFTSAGVSNVEEVLECVDSKVTDTMNNILCALDHESEV